MRMENAPEVPRVVFCHWPVQPNPWSAASAAAASGDAVDVDVTEGVGMLAGVEAGADVELAVGVDARVGAPVATADGEGVTSPSSASSPPQAVRATAATAVSMSGPRRCLIASMVQRATAPAPQREIGALAAST